MKDVEDSEVQLQIRHCIWAVDFYLGRHESCLAATDAGLPLYDPGRGREGLTLYGGHDAKVCGLSHRGLSLWFVGRPASAIRAVAEAKEWAKRTGHAGSIAHAYYNEVMLQCYRRDFDALRSVLVDMRRLTEEHRLRSLAAATEIFEGWAEGNAGRLDQGKEMIKRGLAVHAELQTPEDYPVYCGMLAELLALTGDFAAGLELLSAAEGEAEKAGHRYWLAALHHRRARLLYEEGAGDETVCEALVKSLDIASGQNAVPLLLDAYDTLLHLNLSPDIESRYRGRAERAREMLEPGAPLVVHPEEPLRIRSAVHSA